MSAELSTNIDALFNKLEGFISTKTVVGEPVNIGGVIIVPLVDVSFGLGVGGSDSTKETKGKTDVNIGGMGGKITPSAVLVIINGTAQLINVKNQDSINKLIDMVPGILSKLNFDTVFSKKNKESKPDVEFSDIKIGEI